MYNSPVPLMIIRPDVDSLIEVNGQLIGECTASSFTALPISDSGDYYVCAVPLQSKNNELHYSVTRKVSFDNGSLTGTLADDVKMCFWPGGVFELYIKTGQFLSDSVEKFPYTLSSMALDNFRELTLYYENGLKLAVTNRNSSENCAFSLGNSLCGRLESTSFSGNDYIAVFTNLKDDDRLILFDKQLNNTLDICADSISITSDGKIEKIDNLNTKMKHQKRTLITLNKNGEFCEEAESMGFFTHEYEYPKDRLTLSTAFCEAVREDFCDEALSYLTDSLKATVTFDALKEFLGDFDSVRPPISQNDGSLLGLLKSSSSALLTARLFEFEFEEMKISNVESL